MNILKTMVRILKNKETHNKLFNYASFSNLPDSQKRRRLTKSLGYKIYNNFI